MDRNHHHQQLRQPTFSASSPSQLDPDQLDSTPQDVLVEARKSLQVLIDSGFSRDLLHQWVDDSQSLQFSLSMAPHSFAASQPQQSLAPSHPPPPPPSQPCPPPPSPAPSERSTPVVSVSRPPPPATPVPSIAIKPEALPDDVSRTWPPSTVASPSDQPDADPSSLFMAPPPLFSQSHRPRISIMFSSTGLRCWISQEKENARRGDG